MAHPLEEALHLVKTYAPLMQEKQQAIAAIEAMLPYITDDVRVCRDCQREFFLPEGAKVYFHVRGWKEPVRCRNCRDARRA